ncbi:hypothetical protein M2321_003271 [Rhodoblastus acidophilus]|nr:hypothetical protein [Rhodoblastus acidophilus]
MPNGLLAGRDIVGIFAAPGGLEFETGERQLSPCVYRRCGYGRYEPQKRSHFLWPHAGGG